MEPIIRIENIHKYFGEVHALRGVSLDVQKGEVVIIIGPSGSGKSTLLRCINRLEEYDEGEITVDNIPLDTAANINAVRTEVGMVFQQFNLFSHLTVLDNINLAQRLIRKRSRDECAKVSHGIAGARGHPGEGAVVSHSTLRRAAAARGDCARAGDESQDHAVRRTDQRARSGDDQGSAGRDARSGARRA